MLKDDGVDMAIFAALAIALFCFGFLAGYFARGC